VLSGGARRAVAGGFVLLFAAVMAGEYAFFRRALEEVRTMGPAGAALTLYFIETVLALIFLLALLSFVASGIFLYYRARDTGLLLASPLPLGGLYALRTLETFALTGWSLGVVGLPALLALGVAFHQALLFYVYGALILGAFGVLTGAAGALVTTAAGLALRRAPSRLAVALTIAALLGLFVLVVGRNVVPSAADFYALFEPEMLNGKSRSLAFIEARFALWPTHPFAAALYANATGIPAGSAPTRVAVWLAPLAALALAATLGRWLYARSLPAAAEGLVLTGTRRAGRTAPRSFPRLLRGPVGACIERDIVTLVRNPHELSRAAFMVVLLALYTSFIVVAPLREVADRPQATGRLLFFTVIAAGYFITAFGLRFVFPSTSLEGRAAWLFFSSPLDPFRLLLARAALYATLLAVTVVPVGLIGVVRLAPAPDIMAAIAGLLLLVAGTTATVLLVLGAAWPDFRDPDPESLSTSGAGLGGAVLCLVYVAGVGWIARSAVLATPDGAGVVTWLLAATAVSVALMTGALGLARRRLGTLEAP
jgi:ABC-2 type transport system permease protein